MDINLLYTSSPDWIKALMVILPHGTLVGLVWLMVRRPAQAQPPLPATPKPSGPPVIRVLPHGHGRLALDSSERELELEEMTEATTSDR